MRLLLLLILLPATIWSQSDSDNFPFTSSSQVIKDSRKITDETFDLKFQVKVLPDNAWFLKLNKDATFEYIHWSGWGESGGTVLEKGKYSIKDNLIQIQSEKENSGLKNVEFYLVTSPTETTDNSIDCDNEGESIYCLYYK